MNRFAFAVLLAVMISMVGTGCSHHFAKVDFKYTSDAHLPPPQRFLEVRAKPSKVGELVKEFVAQEKGQVDSSESNLNFRLISAPDGDAAWQATKAIHDQEWHAFAQDDFRLYKAIDRSSPNAQKPQMLKVDEAGAGGAWVRATLAPRVGHAKRSVTVHFTVSWKTSEQIETHLNVWWWPQPSGSTLIYAQAIPYMTKYKVEAALGNWVQHELWSATTGAADAEIVRRLFEFVSNGQQPKRPQATSMRNRD